MSKESSDYPHTDEDVEEIENSTPITKKYKFSRYNNAMATFLPFRSTDPTRSFEMSVDAVGCYSNSSFNWVRKYLISSKAWNSYKDSLSPFIESLITDDKLRIPNAPSSDSCEVNGQRFLHLFKAEQQGRDPNKISMFRVAWKFCSTRVLMSTLIYTMSIFIGLLSTVLFLRLSLQSMEREYDLIANIYNKVVERVDSKTDDITYESPHHETLKLSDFYLGNADKNNVTAPSLLKQNFLPMDLFDHATGFNNDGDDANKNASELFSIIGTQLMTASLFMLLNLTKEKDDVAVSEFMRFEKDVQIEQLNRVGFSLGLVLCFFGSFYLKSVTNWMNLRTATRLRSAVLSSVYRKSMESAIGYNIAAHQILTFANEESNVIFSFVEHGALVFGTTIGISMALAAAFVLLDVTGFWPIIVMVILLGLLATLAKVASGHFRVGMLNSGKKLTVVQEVCINFKNIIVLGFEKIFLDKFFAASVNHHSSIRKYVLWSSASFVGGITSAVLMTGLYINWCYIRTDAISVLVLIIIFAHFVMGLTLEFGQSVQSIFVGKSALDNLKDFYVMNKPKHFKSRPPHPLVATISDASFKWPRTSVYSSSSSFQLVINELTISTSQVVGITGCSGAGKTSLLLSLLGHTQLIRGAVRLKSNMAFFPKEPVIIAGSLKDNIVMGAEFNPKKYYDAVCAVRLNDDVFVTTDTDEIPIGALELSREQLERVALARACYSESEVFLIDEPLASMKDSQKGQALFYLQNVLDYLLLAGKTVVLATQVNLFLAKCQKIYYLDDGKILKNGTYFDFLNVAVFTKMIQEYEVLRNSEGFDEKMDGCHANAINIVKAPKVKLSRRSIRIHTPASNINTDELLMEQANKIKAILKNLPVMSYVFFFVVYIVSSLMYYSLPFGFIVIIKRQYVDPWLAYISVAMVATSFMLDMLSRFHLAFVSEVLSRRYERFLFFKLFHTTLNYLKTKIISDIVNWFNMDMFTAFQPYATIIQCSVAIFFSLVLLIISNPWTMLLPPFLVAGFVYIYLSLQYTISHLYTKEYESRNKLCMLVTNHLKARVVIQVDKFDGFYKSAHKIIEENTTTIFLRKSIKYHGQFLVNCMLGFGLSITCLILLLIPFSKLSIHRYVLAIFAYYSLSYYLNRLMFEGLLDIIVSKIKLENTKNNKKQIEMIKSPVAVETITDPSKVSVSFKEVICKIAAKSILEIRKVHCRDAEVLGVIGKGAECVVPMIFRILYPDTGATFLSEHDLSQFCETQLKALLGVVLSDPYVHNISVKTFMDPRSKYQLADITGALRNAKIFEKLKPYLDEPMQDLAKSDRQLLCLAKCLLTRPKVIIFENLHPEAQYVMDICIKKHFNDSTVIIIGRSDNQFGVCDRISELV